MTSHGFNPVSPTLEQWEVMPDAWEEEVLETDPVKVEITYRIDEDVLSLLIDEHLNVIEVRDSRYSEAA